MHLGLVSLSLRLTPADEFLLLSNLLLHVLRLVLDIAFELADCIQLVQTLFQPRLHLAVLLLQLEMVTL